MSTQSDIKSQSEFLIVDNHFVTIDEFSFPSQIVDTQRYSAVTFFCAMYHAVFNSTIFSIDLIEESDASNMAGKTVVPTSNIIGDLADAREVGTTNHEGFFINRVGVFGTKRYVQFTTGNTIPLQTQMFASYAFGTLLLAPDG